MSNAAVLEERIDIPETQILKDAFQNRNGELLLWKQYVVDPKHREEIRQRIENDLSGHVDDLIAYRASTIVDEALQNAHEHCKMRKTRMYLGVFEDRVYLSVHYSKEFDASNVRLSMWNPNGTIYTGDRGRGYALMASCASELGLLSKGKWLFANIALP